MFQQGDRLLDDGRYEIIEQIGRGGMGIVYKARDTNLDRLVAVKVLPPTVANDRRAIRDLKHEAKTNASLIHDNIVMVYDMIEWRDDHFIIMEFVEGRTVENILVDSFPLLLEQMLDITIQASTGLHYIHEHQVLHRDIKPHNIMVANGGVVKIGDFGIAHVINQTVARLTGLTTGTEAYMAPELFQIRPADVRTDIYAFGVTLYQILTDMLPFPGPAFAYQHQEVAAIHPNERRPDMSISPELSAIALRCLAKNPADRYSVMAAVLADLKAIQQRLSVAGRIPELANQARLQHKKGNYQIALQIWQSILDVDPHNEDAQAGLAEAQRVLGIHEEKEAAAAQVQALLQEMQAEAADGHYEKVIELGQRALQLDPDNKAAQSYLDHAQRIMEEEQAEYNKQARIQELFQQAKEASAARDYQQVIELSQEVLELDPGNAGAKSGIESAKKALNSRLKERDRLIAQAQEKQRSKNFGEALVLWKQVLDIDPQNQTAKAGVERAEKSLAEQQRAEKDGLIRQAQEKQKAGHLEEAIQLWEKVLRMEPDNQTAKSALASARKALKERRGELNRLLAQVEQEERDGRFEAAVQIWERILELDPDNETAQSSLKADREILENERALERQRKEEKNREKQRQQREEEERRRSRQSQVQALISQAQNEEQAGNTQRAHEIWERVLQIVPDNQIVKDGLARTETRSAMKKIEYAVGAAGLFIHHLHQGNFDRCMIATFGNTFRVEQGFTSNEAALHNALIRIGNSINSEMTRLYDSIEDMIYEFWRYGSRDRPWLLTIITDGQDNQSTSYRHDDRRSPGRIGDFVAQKFNHEPSNFPFLIGVGEGNQINADALATVGERGGFPAVTIAAFPLLEMIFLRIALQVSTQLVGRTINIGNMSWEQVAAIRQLSRTPIDYAFLIDRSGSMSDPG